MKVVEYAHGLDNPNKDKTKEHLLISFALFAYNQEEYIREAVESAFSQTYAPLEIILSDDSSNDRTFHIMKEMVQNYRGPHKIVLNQTNNNQGLATHINQVFQLAQGEWIVMAAGDDISAPNRVEVIETYIDKRCTAIRCAQDLVDQKGNLIFTDGKNLESTVEINLEDLSKDYMRCGVGATYAYKVDIVRTCLPYPNLLGEDRVLPYQAATQGVIYQIPEKLVRRRRLFNSLTNVAKKEEYKDAKKRLALTWITHDKILGLELLKENLDQQRYLNICRYNVVGRTFRTLFLEKRFGRLQGLQNQIKYYFYVFKSGHLEELIRNAVLKLYKR